MNCFNIRELQGILKRRFFVDLVNSHDYKDVLNSTMIGLRFRTNNEMNIYHDTLTFHNFGTTNEAKSRNSVFTNLYQGSFNTSAMNLFNSTLSVSSVTHAITG
jgi:hypothetical protein